MIWVIPIVSHLVGKSTPNIQQLADNGVRFRHFHTSALCAPTRSMLLSGCDNHHAGLGHMPIAHATNQYIKPQMEERLQLLENNIGDMAFPFRYLYNQDQSLISTGNSVKLLNNGEEKFPALFTALPTRIFQ